MKSVTFDANGGLLSAEVAAGFANPGSYTLKLWEKDTNGKAMPDQTGNFINDADDRYALPGPASANDGRIVETLVTLSPPQGSPQYSAVLTILQDGDVLDDLTVEGTTDDPSVTLDLFVVLKRK